MIEYISGNNKFKLDSTLNNTIFKLLFYKYKNNKWEYISFSCRTTNINFAFNSEDTDYYERYGHINIMLESGYFSFYNSYGKKIIKINEVGILALM